MNLHYFVLIVFIVYMLYKGIKAFKAKKQVGAVFLKGSSNYKSIQTMIFSILVVPFVILLDWNLKYLILIVIVFLGVMIEQVYVGELGIKLNDEFFAKERIMHGYMVEDRLDQFEIMIIGRTDTIKMTVSKSLIGKPVEEILEAYLNPIKV
ncbi:hypothetical protein HQN89_11870 [Paenibacillus frigoriresistens]|uniref:hypothetical protein n=1 Tax=Paenibacillus alginolyticus TaxID=59839 RepID=UPI001565AB36|nr:hypothetical protein [Paenibacillus frigoriresistens]NRF91712.1 hypothetical protein [Paenibacillus frigoriresistens]